MITLLLVVFAYNFFGFGFGFSNPALSGTAISDARIATMGAAPGTVQRFASLVKVGGAVLSGPPCQLGWAHYSAGFGIVAKLFFTRCGAIAKA